MPSWEEWLGAVSWNPGSAVVARMNGNTAYGSASDDVTTGYLAAPGALTSALAAAGAGVLGNGLYKYLVTFVNATGETNAGTANAGTTVADYTTNGKIALSAIPMGAAGTTARRLWRTKVGGSTYYLHIAGTAALADNTTVVYTDNIADASLSATTSATVGWNTTGQKGTADPTQAGRTLTGTGPRTNVWTSTKTGRSWYSPSGIADPVGNVWEFVSTFMGGIRGGWAGVGGAVGGATSWGASGYNESDQAYNFLGQSYNTDAGGYTEGLPALLMVGGHGGAGSSAGVRMVGATDSAGSAGSSVGLRAAR